MTIFLAILKFFVVLVYLFFLLVSMLNLKYSDKDSTNAYVAVMNSAYGAVSIDSEIEEVHVMPKMSEEEIKSINDTLNKEF